MDTEPHPLLAPQTARATFRVGDRVVMEAEARTTPLGLLAAGGMVAAILLAIPPILLARRGRAALRPPGVGGAAILMDAPAQHLPGTSPTTLAN
ncbi:hypothetical protein ACQKOH_05065 [Sphingomonas sp. NPDC092331]|jgi:hypothetical protein|uniref:hypothetical protein n=1 Tax=unclassified Sphingomonas TaxID=196159 RepID=UPI0029E8330C|nr:hypothetical protein [Pseudomonadota bacterium]